MTNPTPLFDIAELIQTINWLTSEFGNDERIANIDTIFGTISVEIATNPSQAVIDLTTMLGMLKAVAPYYPSDQMSVAIGCTQDAIAELTQPTNEPGS